MTLYMVQGMGSTDVGLFSIKYSSAESFTQHLSPGQGEFDLLSSDQDSITRWDDKRKRLVSIVALNGLQTYSQMLVAGHWKTPAKMFKAMTRPGLGLVVYRQLAGNPAVTQDLLGELVDRTQGDSSSWVAIAKNPNVTSEILERMSDVDHERVAQLIAGHPKTTLATLQKITGRWQVPEVLDALATNRNTTADILDRLKKNRDESVRKHVAKHPNVSSEILADMGKDKSEKVRLAIAGNEKTPRQVLESMVAGNNKRVAEMAERTLRRKT